MPHPTPTPRRYNLALGLSPHVNELAARTGSLLYSQAAGNPVFTAADFTRVAQGATVINFTLKGFEVDQFNRFIENPGISNLPGVNNITNYELFRVLTDPSLFRKTVFHDIPAGGVPKIK
jgi:hypothetical protein